MKGFIQVVVFVFFSCIFMTQSFAGEPVNKKISNELKVLSSTMKQVANHLEFLGYKIETSDKEVKPYFIAYHDIEHNVLVTEPFPNFIYLHTYLLSKKRYSPEMVEFLNKSQPSFNISTVYVNEDKETKEATLHFVAIYTGGYVRELFGTFFEMYKKDMNIIRSMNNYEKIFLDR